jgi:hypothetical protein
MYLQEDHQATGLILLLSIGLRVLTLLKGVARQRLAECRETLVGLYQNPQDSEQVFDQFGCISPFFGMKDLLFNHHHANAELSTISCAHTIKLLQM